jgi:pSer/pThr/pTyr-binding forkhead associated (FHA) protein
MSKTGMWRRIGAAFERSDIGASDPAEYRGGEPGGDELRLTATRHAPIREAVERRISGFLRRDLVSHLEIGSDEVFMLHYIEIAAAPENAAALDYFLHEFSPHARVEWVKRLLAPAIGRHVNVDQFLALEREFAPEALAETDPFEEELNAGTQPAFNVVLHGRWAPTPSPPTEAAMDPAASATDATAADGKAPDAAVREPDAPSVPGPRVQLRIRDAAGERDEPLERFPAVLGSSAQADVQIAGYYVSARHCTLHWESGQLRLADHSTNGTWVDGERVARGARATLANGAVLGFGRDRGAADPGRYPELQLAFGEFPPAGRFTPVAPSLATPVAPALEPMPARARPAAPVLAVLAVADAAGESRRDVQRLPYTVGRGSAQDYVVPKANLGVSREHLVIESVDATGATVLNRAVHRNGTFAGGQAQPERFTWAFGVELLLGEKWSDAPPVRLSLQRFESAS